jgi:hypothetical protein
MTHSIKSVFKINECPLREDEHGTGQFSVALKKFDSSDAPSVIPNDAMDGMFKIAKAFDQENWDEAAKGKLSALWDKFLSELGDAVKELPAEKEGEEDFEKV